jgi:polysaccharide export outer membrane protein
MRQPRQNFDRLKSLRSYRALSYLALALLCVGCRGGAFQASTLPQEFRARPNPGDVSMNMARMTGNGYDNFLIGPDDLLEVTVVTGRTDEEAKPVAVRVAKDGTLDVSPIGPVPVGNLDPVEASQRLASAAIERGIYLQPNITIEFKRKAINHITVLGAVKNPGLIEVPRNSSDVVSAIALAGGMTEEAGTEVEIIRHNTQQDGHTRFATTDSEKSGSDLQESEIELAAYSTLNQPQKAPMALNGASQPLAQRIDLAMLGAGVSTDYRLQDRDVVTIKPRPKRNIHVGGLVKTPGQFELPPTEDMRLLDAIALAGGSSSIVADKVFIIRPIKGRPQPLVIQASMQKAKHNGAENLLIAEGDMISIEQTPVTAIFDTASKLFHLTVGVTGNNFF